MKKSSERLLLRNKAKSNIDWYEKATDFFNQEMTAIGKFAKEQREMAGLTIEEVAKRMGVVENFIARFERGSIGWSNLAFTKWENAIFGKKEEKAKKRVKRKIKKP